MTTETSRTTLDDRERMTTCECTHHRTAHMSLSPGYGPCGLCDCMRFIESHEAYIERIKHEQQPATPNPAQRNN